MQPEETESVTWKFFIFPPDRRVRVSVELDIQVAELLRNGNRPAWAAIIDFIQTRIDETEVDEQWN